MAVSFTESVIEEAALTWLESLGWRVAFGPDLAPGGPSSEREDYRDPVLAGRLRAAAFRLNPGLAAETIEEAVKQALRSTGPDLVATNRTCHRLLVDGVVVDGVVVDARRGDGTIRGETVRLIDLDDPGRNDWLAVNQYTITGADERRPDIVLLVNGLPLAVIELKNAADRKATIWGAFNQLQTYKLKIPALFAWNLALVVSDGILARVGSLTADRERFMPWRTIEGEELAAPELSQLEVLLKGALEPGRFLELLRHFTVFEDEGGGRVTKKLAGYHQFHAVRGAVAATTRAMEGRDRRIGVIWHT